MFVSKVQKGFCFKNTVLARLCFIISVLCCLSQIARGVSSYTWQPSDPVPSWLDDIQEHVVTNDLPRTNVNVQALLPLLVFKSKNGDAWCEGCLGNLMMEGIELPLNCQEGIRMLRDSAEKGCGQSMLELGERYENGRGVKVDYVEALHWLRLAADNGFALAQADMGYCYSMGLGVATNNVEAMKWFQKAAEQTNAFSMMHIGIMYFYGLDVRRDYVVAEKWMLPAAKLGNARAMFFMGQLAEKNFAETNPVVEAFNWYQKSAEKGDRFGCLKLAMAYFNGTGTEKNPTNSIYWAEKAATQGVGDAQNFLGDIYHFGKYAPKDENVAQEWYQRAVTNNQPQACVRMAESLGYPNLHSNLDDFSETHRLMLVAAQAGHRGAEFNVAMGCFRGDGGVTNYEAGQHWLMESARTGWPMAEYYLGLSYLNGSFQFSKDTEEGVKWLRQAAVDNCLLAFETLGIKLMMGVDVPRDPIEGIKWFRQGAEFGDAKCQNDLGYALETSGTETPDLIEVCMWDVLAANQGISQARVNLARVLPKLSDSQRQELRRRLEQFKPKPLPDINAFKL